MHTDIIGWDIGGAHLKAAHLSVSGDVLAVCHVACPIWLGLDQLDKAISSIKQQLDVKSLELCRHAVTMTAELVDLFENRGQGVEAILKHLTGVLPDNNTWVFCGQHRVLPIEQIFAEHYALIASANWQASAHLMTTAVQNVLLIDIGSTTTDIMVIENHQLKTSAQSDFERLVSGELVYTGVVRTPVMAVCQDAEFQKMRVPVVAEYFATMADVYRILNQLPDNADQGKTADGRAKTRPDSVRRLARMIGLDAQFAKDRDWFDLAQSIKERQLSTLVSAIQNILNKQTVKQPLVVGAGVGRFLIEDIATRMALDYRQFEDCIQFNHNRQSTITNTDCISDHAPAVAVALMLDQYHNDQAGHSSIAGKTLLC